MKIREKVKKMIQNWLEIVPAADQTIVLQEKLSRELETLRSQIWYRGDASELHQFFRQLPFNSGGFWSCVPNTNKVRKIHSGIPAVIVDTLAYIVKSDLDKVQTDSEEWEEISQSIDFRNLVGKAVADTLVDGDGAFKISVDTSLSPYPIVEFIGGDTVDFEISRGILSAIVFKTVFTAKSRKFVLHERYGRGFVESRLYDSNGNERLLNTVPELANIPKMVEFNGDHIMAVPLKFYDSKKYHGRGKSIFDGGKSDCFDALDEVISQWIDAVRAGRVRKYIPHNMIPRSPDDGSLKRLNDFGTEFVMFQAGFGDEGSSQIEVVQPEIKYEAFVSTYANALLMCLQGLVSPATLGIDVGKMSSADAQREKKDVTGNTRNTITTALEKALPELIEAVLKTYDNMQEKNPENYDISVDFGEYGAPDFDSRVETVGKACTYGIMSIETQVEELWGSSKDDEWKADEVQRIKSEKGLLEVSEPSVGGEP
ncbi:MAG: phage portal protein [Ruminococcus flavefaciens]|nr:phage portal protein [Ruminococcus flavefaciens]